MQNGLNALHKAAKHGHSGVVKLLVASGRFKLNQQDKVSMHSIALQHIQLP
jgi:ankyrin repeat protein